MPETSRIGDEELISIYLSIKNTPAHRNTCS